jgi:hypothetical protein
VRPEDIRAYKQRWELVAAVERDELRRMTLEQKLADAAMLMDTARRLGWETHTAAEIEEVRARWNLLVERMSGR